MHTTTWFTIIYTLIQPRSSCIGTLSIWLHEEVYNQVQNSNKNLVRVDMKLCRHGARGAKNKKIVDILYGWSQMKCQNCVEGAIVVIMKDHHREIDHTNSQIFWIWPNSKFNAMTIPEMIFIFHLSIFLGCTNMMGSLSDNYHIFIVVLSFI